MTSVAVLGRTQLLTYHSEVLPSHIAGNGDLVNEAVDRFLLLIEVWFAIIDVSVLILT